MSLVYTWFLLLYMNNIYAYVCTYMTIFKRRWKFVHNSEATEDRPWIIDFVLSWITVNSTFRLAFFLNMSYHVSDLTFDCVFWICTWKLKQILHRRRKWGEFAIQWQQFILSNKFICIGRVAWSRNCFAALCFQDGVHRWCSGGCSCPASPGWRAWVVAVVGAAAHLALQLFRICP